MLSPALRWAGRPSYELHFDGSAQIKFEDPYDAVNDWWCSLFFKPDTNFFAGSPSTQYITGKYDDATNYLYLYLQSLSGALILQHREGNGAESVSSTKVSWSANTWYHILASISTTNGMRLRVNGGTADMEAAKQTAISLTNDFVIGTNIDTGTSGFKGIIKNVIMDDTALSAANELELSKGITVTTPKNIFRLDEGHGLIAYDKGSGADNGTLDASCLWRQGQRLYVR